MAMGRIKAKPPNTQAHQENEEGTNLETLSSNEMEVVPPTLPTTQVDKLDLILAELRSTCTALEAQIGTISIGLDLLKADHKNLAEKVKSHRLALDDLVQQTEHTTCLEQMQKQINGLQERADDAEGRASRNNVRILGIPEKSEGKNPTEFVEQWLRRHITTEGLTDHFSVERAHRLPARPPQPGRPPRPFIARILDYRDRDTLLRAAREKAPILFENKTISLYPDFTLTVQKARATFMEAKKKLRAHNLKYALLFPARLRVIHNQKAISWRTLRRLWNGWRSLIHRS